MIHATGLWVAVSRRVAASVVWLFANRGLEGPVLWVLAPGHALSDLLSPIGVVGGLEPAWRGIAWINIVRMDQLRGYGTRGTVVVNFVHAVENLARREPDGTITLVPAVV